MMFRQLVLAVGVTLGLMGGASAQTDCTCPGDVGPRLSFNELNNVLTGNTVCVGSAPTWQAQEQHVAGGVLNDYKRGPADAVDPTKRVGSWSTGNGSLGAQVTYTYGGTSYTFGVCSTSNAAPASGNLTQAIGFCPMNPNPGTATSGTLRPGLTGC